MKKLLVCLLLAPFFLSSCDKINSTEIELPQISGGCLITPNMFTKDWKWSEESLYSTESQPSVDNHYLNTKILLMMTGRNKSKAQKLKVFSRLSVYSKPIDWSENINYPRSDELNLQIFPKFINIGKNLQTGCLKEGNVSVCLIDTTYNTHSLRITATGSYIPSESDMENILNPVLSTIDSCITDLEKNQ